MRHYIAGEHHEEVCRLFAGLVLIDFKDIPITFLKKIFDTLPPALIENNAQLLFIRAKVMSVGGEIQRAIRDFQIALSLFEEENDVDGIANCRKEIGFHYYLTGKLERAIQEMDAIRDRSHKDPFFPLEMAGFLILFSAITGDVDGADEYYGSAVRKFAVSDNFDMTFIRTWLELCHSYRFHVAGNFRKADALNKRVITTFVQMELDNFLPITYFQAALTVYYLVDYSQGCECAEKGLMMAARQGVYDSQYVWLLYARALNHYGMGTYDQAFSDAEASLDLFREYENAWGGGDGV